MAVLSPKLLAPIFINARALSRMCPFMSCLPVASRQARRHVKLSTTMVGKTSLSGGIRSNSSKHAYCSLQ